MATIHLPRTIRVGGGALSDLPDAMAELGLAWPLVITDPWIAGSGMLDRLLDVLTRNGCRARVFADAVPDPTVASVDAAMTFLRAGQHDCVIGFGGGSSIDTAKVVAVKAVHDVPVSSLKVPHQQVELGLPIIAVPTTAGTGSEATRVTVITDTATDEKMLCAGLAYLPTVSICDFELTLSKPARLTADTGIDSLVHAIEAYVSRRANPFADAAALSAMRLIWPHLPIAYREPGNRDAREALMLGALQGGIAFSNSSVALVHGMSRPIGAHFHVSHGLSNAMLMPLVTQWSGPSALPRYAQCARTMGIASLEEGDQSATARLIDALYARNTELDVPSPAQCGIDQRRWEDLIPTMAEQALASGSPANNPRVPAVDEIAALYRVAWQ